MHVRRMIAYMLPLLKACPVQAIGLCSYSGRGGSPTAARPGQVLWSCRERAGQWKEAQNCKVIREGAATDGLAPLPNFSTVGKKATWQVDT